MCMFAEMTAELVDIEMAAHGGAVVEVRRDNGKWQVVGNSSYARRIDANTPMEITGPAAGHPRLKTSADPTGRRVLGMINNCAGGITPWGTWLTCEENFHGYFHGQLPERIPRRAITAAMAFPATGMPGANSTTALTCSRSRTRPNRFGWIVEIDPFDPNSTPKKRTALGRGKHEGAAGVINADGRYVIYSGDDERFEYVYRFVTAARVDRVNPQANRDILDDGVLSVARYNADGTVDWLSLVHGQGPLTADERLRKPSRCGDRTRRAADLRRCDQDGPSGGRRGQPDHAESLCRAHQQQPAQTRADRRRQSACGQSVRTHHRNDPAGGDHAAATFHWEILVQCGDPAVAEVGATFSTGTTANGWFGMPDNVAFDSQGRLWVATDGNSRKRTGRTDGLWGVETEGPGRGTSRHFYRVPVGAELCGPCFTPDDETLFVAVQHPGEGESAGVDSTFEEPATRWPDFKPDMPPRPSVVAITRRGGGKIAS